MSNGLLIDTTRSQHINWSFVASHLVYISFSLFWDMLLTNMACGDQKTTILPDPSVLQHKNSGFNCYEKWSPRVSDFVM